MGMFSVHIDKEGSECNNLLPRIEDDGSEEQDGRLPG